MRQSASLWSRPFSYPLLLAILATLSPMAWADADSARNSGAAWLIKQQRGDGSWANAYGELAVQSTAAAVLALKNSGLSKSPTFGTAAAWLANADADSIDSVARQTEALASAGLNASAQASSDRLYGLRSQSTLATWGGYGGSGVDFLDTALGLTALRLGDSTYSAKSLVASGNVLLGAFCELATNRVSVASGKQAWPVTKAAANQSSGQGRPSVMSTALVLTELRGMQKAVGFASATCNGTAYTFAALQSEAQAWLLDQQNAGGGFGEQRTDGSKGTSSVLVTALVYRALNTQTTPPQPAAGNAQTWLLAQQDNVSGSWRNDPLVTAQVLSVLPAATGIHLVDTDRDGITNTVEAALGSNQAIADARNQIGTPTLAVTGANTTAFALSATTGQAFSYTLGGSAPFTLKSGNLPPGLTVNPSTGLISGTPTQTGSYSFDYQLSTGLVIGRIDIGNPVVVASSGDGDAPLPEWALAALAVALLGIGQRKRKSGQSAV